MHDSCLDRKRRSQWVLAGLGTIMAGTLTAGVVGCGGGADPGAGSSAPATTATAGSGGAMATPAMDMHACRGLNGCKGQGADGKNACAGQGGCASAAMHHECKGQNACKGQGGCGEMMGKNECKGHGGCAVPMKDDAAWQMARAAMEARMKEAGKEVGPAPAKM
jgi:hypothetical protein